jgi:hypothetical protein
LVLAGRWFYFQLFTDDHFSRVPSLVAAAVCVQMAVTIWVLGFVADLLSANRRVMSDVRFRLRRDELDGRPTE